MLDLEVAASEKRTARALEGKERRFLERAVCLCLSRTYLLEKEKVLEGDCLQKKIEKGPTGHIWYDYAGKIN